MLASCQLDALLAVDGRGGPGVSGVNEQRDPVLSLQLAARNALARQRDAGDRLALGDADRKRVDVGAGRQGHGMLRNTDCQFRLTT